MTPLEKARHAARLVCAIYFAHPGRDPDQCTCHTCVRNRAALDELIRAAKEEGRAEAVYPLARAYQKAQIYGSLAQRYRDAAIAAGALAPEHRLEAAPCTDEAALAFARAELSTSTAGGCDELRAQLRKTIEKRDAFHDRIDAIADALGDETEWSSANDRGECALELAHELRAKLAEATGLCRQLTEDVREWGVRCTQRDGEIFELRTQLTEAERGDPHGHLLSVYQVLLGRQGVADELYDGEKAHYERVITAATELRAQDADAERERIRLFELLKHIAVLASSTLRRGQAPFALEAAGLVEELVAAYRSAQLAARDAVPAAALRALVEAEDEWQDAVDGADGPSFDELLTRSEALVESLRALLPAAPPEPAQPACSTYCACHGKPAQPREPDLVWTVSGTVCTGTPDAYHDGPAFCLDQTHDTHDPVGAYFRARPEAALSTEAKLPLTYGADVAPPTPTEDELGSISIIAWDPEFQTRFRWLPGVEYLKRFVEAFRQR